MVTFAGGLFRGDRSKHGMESVVASAVLAVALASLSLVSSFASMSATHSCSESRIVDRCIANMAGGAGFIVGVTRTL